MHPRWRCLDIRDRWPEAMQRRTDDTAEEDVSRQHFPARRNMSVLCYGDCSAILSLEKVLISAYNIREKALISAYNIFKFG